MIVWHVPDDGSGQNSYGHLLSKCLRARGVTITGVAYSHFFSLRVLAHRPDVLHFEFISPYILPHQSDAVPVAILKGILFVTQAALLRLAGIRLVWTMHRPTNYERRFVHVEWFFSLIFTRIAHVLVAHGRGSRRAFIAHFSLQRATRHVQEMPHPSFIGGYPNEMSRDDARKELGVDPNARMFLILGQIRGYKNVPQAIAAFTRATAAGDGNELWVVGAPIDRAVADDVHRCAAEHQDVRLVLEHVPDERLQLYLNACDFVVLNYAISSSGVAILAMSFARAVIAARGNGMEQTLDERGAIFFDRDDPHGLDEAFCRGVAMVDRSAEMGQSNFNNVSRWSLDDAAAQFVKWYTRS